MPDALDRLLAVDDAARRFRNLGRFDPAVIERINNEFVPARISDTLRIEGIRVSERVTKAILEGLAVSEVDRYTETEVLNIDRAHDLIDESVATQRTLSSDLVRELHYAACDGLVDGAGSFRTRPVAITGASITPPPWADVPELIENLVTLASDHREAVHAITLACWVHATFTAIHPFIDGNGRVGRLIQDFILIGAGLLPVGVPISRRGEYYDALAAADDGRMSEFIKLVATAELAALERALRIAEAPIVRRETIARLVAAAEANAKRVEYNSYQLWIRQFDHFAGELEAVAEIFNANAETFALRVIRYSDNLTFDTWREIAAGESEARSGWALEVSLSRFADPLFQILFWAGRHDVSRVVSVVGFDHPPENVALFVVGAEPGLAYPYEDWRDSVVASREVIFTGNELIEYRDPRITHVRLEAPDDAVNQLERSWGWVPRRTYAENLAESLAHDLLAKFGLV